MDRSIIEANKEASSPISAEEKEAADKERKREEAKRYLRESIQRREQAIRKEKEDQEAHKLKIRQELDVTFII